MRYPHTDFRRHQATCWMLVGHVPAEYRACIPFTPTRSAMRYQQLLGDFTLSESIASTPHLSPDCAPCGVARTR